MACSILVMLRGRYKGRGIWHISTMASTNSQTKSSTSGGIGMKLKGGVQVAKGLGDSWGSGINGAHANATTNSAGFPPPKGQEYAQNSTTASNMKTDLGRGPNAYSGNDQQPPQYPAPGGPPPQDYKGGMSYTNPTELGNRPTNSMAGEQGYEQRQNADHIN
ncbi:hypothetical protein B0H17DRAFT_1092003, partial [Mycena rosella]